MRLLPTMFSFPPFLARIHMCSRCISLIAYKLITSFRESYTTTKVQPSLGFNSGHSTKQLSTACQTRLQTARWGFRASGSYADLAFRPSAGLRGQSTQLRMIGPLIIRNYAVHGSKRGYPKPKKKGENDVKGKGLRISLESKCI